MHQARRSGTSELAFKPIFIPAFIGLLLVERVLDFGATLSAPSGIRGVRQSGKPRGQVRIKSPPVNARGRLGFSCGEYSPSRKCTLRLHAEWRRRSALGNAGNGRPSQAPRPCLCKCRRMRAGPVRVNIGVNRRYAQGAPAPNRRAKADRPVFARARGQPHGTHHGSPMDAPSTNPLTSGFPIYYRRMVFCALLLSIMGTLCHQWPMS